MSPGLLHGSLRAKLWDMAKPPRFNHGNARKRKIRSIWQWLRPALVLLALLLAWRGWSDPQLRSTIGLPMPAGVSVDARFALCDAPGYSANCVVDGDTFRMGDRRIRIEGIDAPEREGRCPAESALARTATNDLLQWLNQGRFAMLPQSEAVRDQYGRELQSLWRESADGSRDDLADHMIGTGRAERYGSTSRRDWCR